MIAWLINNKEWFFSGVGAVIAGGLVTIIYEKSKLNISNPHVDRPETEKEPWSEDDYHSHPTLGEIKSQIEAAPPYQQTAIKNSFTGLRVKWELKLSTASPTEKGKVRVMLSGPRIMDPFVMFTVSGAKYPALKLAHEGVPVWVAGSITGVDLGTVLLSNVKLKITLKPTV